MRERNATFGECFNLPRVQFLDWEPNNLLYLSFALILMDMKQLKKNQLPATRDTTQFEERLKKNEDDNLGK
jgi:hypothetical protein